MNDAVRHGQTCDRYWNNIMRTFGHWTPRYIKNRIATLYYEKAYPDHPWLTQKANEILESYLTKSDAGLEFGSGRSTIWLAGRVGKLKSVEHNSNWAAHVRNMLEEKNIDNVEYMHCPKDKKDEEGGDSEYVKVADYFDVDSLDFCLVDGVYREFCVLKAIDKLRPGGVLIIDNVNRYLPSQSYSPSSRSTKDGPLGPVWGEVAKAIDSWRKIWTTSGVTDTALYFKPCIRNSQQGA